MKLALLLTCICAVASAQEFRTAQPDYPFQFPRDHGSHRDFRTEWWYFTGNLRSANDEEFGFKLTFFRNALVHPDLCPREDAPLALCDFHFAHFALTNITDGSHGAWERVGREGLAGAHTTEDTFSAQVGEWSGIMQDDGSIALKAGDGGDGIALTLTPSKPFVIHGERGAHQKAAIPGQASHYITFSRMDATGTITMNGASYPVHGTAWMDHEFGSEQLGMTETGWAWFSIQLGNGEELMLYQLRRDDGSYDPVALSSLIAEDGTLIPLPAPKAYQIEETRHWSSPHTGARYPVSWVITIPDHGGRLEVTTPVDDQEMNMTRSSGLSYWEGATRINGTWRGSPITGVGYTELVGYAHGVSR